MTDNDSLAAALRALRSEIGAARDRISPVGTEGLATTGAASLVAVPAGHVARIEARVAAVEARQEGERPA